MNNIGLKNEEQIMNYINECKYINKMNTNMQSFIKSIFNFDISENIIKAYKFAENYKPDLIISANGISKYVSIKTGENNSVHQEHIYSFVRFLSTLGLKDQEIEKLLLFHFNDGTNNGSGTSRKNAYDFIEKEQEFIQKANSFFNTNNIAEKCLERILFKGEYYNLPLVDYIYHGDVENGLWASKADIIKFLLGNKTYSSSIHISKLYYQSLHRNLKYDKYYEYKRYYVQFKWYSIKEDLRSIMNKKV